MMVSNCPILHGGVKLSSVSNCPWYQMVLFAFMVSNCPTCHYGVKLSEVSNGPWCQIVCGVKWSQDREHWVVLTHQFVISTRKLDLKFCSPQNLRGHNSTHYVESEHISSKITPKSYFYSSDSRAFHQSCRALLIILLSPTIAGTISHFVFCEQKIHSAV